MSNQGELGGFCFNCAVRAPQYPTSAPQTQPTHSIQLQNPWPILVRSDNLDLYNTQPLVCTFYNVNSWDRPHKKLVASRPEDRAFLTTYFNRLHEFSHLYALDWTPAKELARIALSRCYECIHVLAYSLMPAEEVWGVFTEATADLDKIEKNIGFVEELFTTTEAIAIMERIINSDNEWIGFQEEIEKLEEIMLAHQEKNYSGFRAAYKRFKPIIPLMLSNPYLLSYSIPLLQPVIKNEDGTLSADNARSHLEIVLDRLSGINNEEEASRRLQVLVEQEREAWELTLDALIKWAGGSANGKDGYRPIDSDDNLAGMLWLISKGEQEDRYTSKGIQSAYAKRKSLGTKNCFVLQQKTYRNQSYITPVYPGTDEDSGTYASEETKKLQHGKLIFFEGLRQQLVARKGLCDHPDTHRNLQRLYHLALEGLFGPGDWSPPPCLPLERR